MRRFQYATAIAVLTLMGCEQDTAQSPDQVEADLWQDELPIRQPWLRDHLPDGSLVYVRIPNIFGVLATPKRNALDAALRSRVNVENLQKIREGFVDNLIPLIPGLSEPGVRTFQRHVRSPIEISATFLPSPAALIVANLDIGSNDAFVSVLDELGLALVAPFDANNIAQVDGAGMPLFVQYDAASGRLLANAGPGVTAASFARLLDATNRDEPHRMQLLESKVDASGQGFFYWVDAQEAMPAMRMFVPRDLLEDLIDLGLDNVEAAAMGWGVADGKGRLSLVADVPTGEDRGYLPYVENDLSARSVGDPDGLFVLSIPTVEEFIRLEALALETMTAESKTDWLQGKQTMQLEIGVSIDDFLESIGPELILIFDRAGDYGAVRLRDPGKWDSVLENIAATTGSAPDQRKVAGNTYYHWSFAYSNEDLGGSLDAEFAWIGELWERSREHTYWTRDGDFLYFASVPQILIDRAAMQPRTHVGRWLEETQRIDASHALISISGTSHKLPRRLYSTYIEILQLLADLGQTEIDVWSMPTASQLALADLGTLGFTLSLGNPTLAAEFTFENNPGELFGGMGTVAVVGILAAIAIPAYQDYTIRARVSMGLNVAGAAKVAVSEYYSENGRFPAAADAAQLSTPQYGADYVESVTVEPDSGRIIIDYLDIVANPDAQVILEPTVTADGHISWSCTSSIANKHLPAACRDQGE